MLEVHVRLQPRVREPQRVPAVDGEVDLVCRSTLAPGVAGFDRCPALVVEERPAGQVGERVVVLQQATPLGADAARSRARIEQRAAVGTGQVVEIGAAVVESEGHRERPLVHPVLEADPRVGQTDILLIVGLGTFQSVEPRGGDDQGAVLEDTDLGVEVEIAEVVPRNDARRVRVVVSVSLDAPGGPGGLPAEAEVNVAVARVRDPGPTGPGGRRPGQGQARGEPPQIDFHRNQPPGHGDRQGTGQRRTPRLAEGPRTRLRLLSGLPRGPFR